MVNFSDLNFIFRFLPVFIIAFYVTPLKYRTWTLLIGSLLFYAVGDLKMLPALVGAVLVNFLFSRAQVGEKSRSLLAFIVAIDAGMLIEFKLLSQFSDSVFLPIGISFYIFKMISFQVDVYRGKISEGAAFVDVAAYFCMFPQITSGPIMRYEDFAKREYDVKKGFLQILKRIEDGLKYFVAGLAMKVLLADHLAMLWKEIGTIGYESISTPLAWLGAYAYSLELYMDFWGYSLMAAGIGVMLGFPFIVNFDHPYASKNVSEFYRRWHATLGSFFKDYVYIPLGGSRKGDFRTVINLFVVWLITGFWHGVTLNFIIWGMALFLIIVFERFVITRLPGKMGAVLGRINVLVLIPLTWVVFAISDLGMLGTYFSRLFPFFGEGIAVNKQDITRKLLIYAPVLVPALILLIPKVSGLWKKNKDHVLFNILWIILFFICIYSAAGSSGNPFLYFRF